MPETHVDAPRQQSLNLIQRGHFQQFDLHQRFISFHGRDQLARALIQHGRMEAHTQLALFSFRHTARQRIGVVGLRHQALRAPVKNLAGSGQGDLPTASQH
ncbi:hypothetical protein D9M69_659090 [compost metagenome]